MIMKDAYGLSIDVLSRLLRRHHRLGSDRDGRRKDGSRHGENAGNLVQDVR